MGAGVFTATGVVTGVAVAVAVGVATAVAVATGLGLGLDWGLVCGLAWAAAGFGVAGFGVAFTGGGACSFRRAPDTTRSGSSILLIATSRSTGSP